MGRLFGTDGIRGVANVDLTPTLAYDLGRAVGHLLEAFGRRVVIGQDTRRSGDMLVAAVSAGLASVGADAIQLGVVTTPCLAHAAASGEFAAGIMVSASHNPADDNGLKVLSGGRKIDDEVEEELERLIFQAESLPGDAERAGSGASRMTPGRSRPTAPCCSRRPATCCVGCGSGSTAPTARPRRSHPTCCASWGRR